MPKELPKAYDPKGVEDKIYKEWEKSGYFDPDVCVKKGVCDKKADSYCISLPPPNRTGILHAGHALMLAVQDILIRFNRMQGKKTLWVPGTDHAAIATQAVVEKKLYKEEKKTRHDLGREKFLEKVVEFAQESHKTITNQVKKMGSSLDWSREAYTLDETRNMAVRSAFKMMYDDGLIYRGDRVVNWCSKCHSTLSDDEVEYEEQKGKLYTFRYSPDFPIEVSTTRPETKLGDTAVAVNPDDKRYKKYVGKKYEVDFVGVLLKIKIIADKSVDSGYGTGAVGVTPAHSAVDWKMAQDHKLDLKKVIDERGKIREGYGEFSGKKAQEARKMIIEKLKAQNLVKEEEIDNNLSVCYRCGTTVEPLPSLQWFVDVNKKIKKYNKSLKELMSEAVKKGVFGRKPIRIIPDHFNKTYFQWIDNLRDWCISRQIWFGHRIPVYYCKKAFSILPAGRQGKHSALSKKCNEPIVSLEEVKKCPHCGGEVEQDSDTLDTWFSSGLWTFSTLLDKDYSKYKTWQEWLDNSSDFQTYHPTSVLETGYDILFFWVARMILMTTYVLGDIPFYDVYLHGLVRDEKGRKMSKSLGNAIDPLDEIEKYGADPVRLSLVIGTSAGNDLKLSDKKIAGFRNFVNKLWNISRFVMMNVETKSEFNSDVSELNSEKASLADKWILSRFNKLIDEVTGDIEEYRFSMAGEKLRDFTWGELADWYLEVSKVEGDKDSILVYVLENLLKLWHPYTPFVTEAIWSNLGKKDFIMVEKWPQADKKMIDEKAEKDFALIKDLIILIRNARAENKIEPKNLIKIKIVSKHKDLIESQAEIVKRLARVESLEVESGKSEKGFLVEILK